MKKIIYGTSEYYLILGVFISGFTPPFSVHPMAIGIIAIMVVQLLYRQKTLGLIIGINLTAINLLMLTNTINNVINLEGLAGLISFSFVLTLFIIIINMMMSVIMIIKNHVRVVDRKGESFNQDLHK